MMLPHDVQQMTPPERAETFQRLLVRRYGAHGIWTGFADEFQIHRVTAQRWLDKPENIPIAVILALEALAETQEERERHIGDVLAREFAQNADWIASSATSLGQAVRLLQEQSDVLLRLLAPVSRR
jgi:hypothetical protein